MNKKFDVEKFANDIKMPLGRVKMILNMPLGYCYRFKNLSSANGVWDRMDFRSQHSEKGEAVILGFINITKSVAILKKYIDLAKEFHFDRAQAAALAKHDQVMLTKLGSGIFDAKQAKRLFFACHSDSLYWTRALKTWIELESDLEELENACSQAEDSFQARIMASEKIAKLTEEKIRSVSTYKEALLILSTVQDRDLKRLLAKKMEEIGLINSASAKAKKDLLKYLSESVLYSENQKEAVLKLAALYGYQK